jgi:hypothetical protein
MYTPPPSENLKFAHDKLDEVGNTILSIIDIVPGLDRELRAHLEVVKLLRQCLGAGEDWAGFRQDAWRLVEKLVPSSDLTINQDLYGTRPAVHAVAYLFTGELQRAGTQWGLATDAAKHDLLRARQAVHRVLRLRQGGKR